MMPDFNELPREDLLDLLVEYDRYIQDANDEDKFHDGWRPVCIEEFYQNEFQMIKDTIERGYF